MAVTVFLPHQPTPGITVILDLSPFKALTTALHIIMFNKRMHSHAQTHNNRRAAVLLHETSDYRTFIADDHFLWFREQFLIRIVVLV